MIKTLKDAGTGYLKTIATNNGVSIQIYGSGKPVVIFPGLEGTGDSCLYLIRPAISQLQKGGHHFKLFLVNYRLEDHSTFGQLVLTVEELLMQVLSKKQVLIIAQSFGNLLALKVANEGNLRVQKIFMVSPFSELSPVLRLLLPVCMKVMPPFLYRAAIKPLSKYLFGPLPAGGATHPFFDALKNGSFQQARRQFSWLKSSYSGLFENVQIPVTMLIGQKDRVINVKRQVAFFKAFCLKANDRMLFVRRESGHVILLRNEVSFAVDKIRSFLS